MATSPGVLPQAASVTVVREGREPSGEQKEKQGSDGSEMEGVSRPRSARTCRQHHGQRCHCRDVRTRERGKARDFILDSPIALHCLCRSVLLLFCFSLFCFHARFEVGFEDLRMENGCQALTLRILRSQVDPKTFQRREE